MNQRADKTGKRPVSDDRDRRAARASRADLAGTDPVAASAGEPPGIRGVAILLGLALVWLAATLISAHASITSNVAEPSVALGATAFALPNVIAATLLAGSSAGLLTATLAMRSPRLAAHLRASLGATEASTRGRLLLGLVAGALVAAACAGLILAGYGGNASVGRLAATIAAAAVIGAAATALPRPVLAAGVSATVAVLLLGLVVSMMQPRLVDLFGATASPASQINASWTLAYVQAAVGGIVAGALSFRVLRRHGSRAWPWYLLAGAAPGILLLTTELLTRTGGAALLGLVRGLSDGDAIAVDVNNFARLRNAMLVLFVGGLTAMVAVGRTLRASEQDDGGGQDPEAGGSGEG
jgi:hypothetical protein